MNLSHRMFKNYLINPRFQLTLIGSFFLIGIVCNVAFYMYIQILFGQLQTSMAGGPYDEILEQVHTRLTSGYIVQMLAILIYIVVIGALLSHRIAGPMHRFHKFLVENKGKKTTPPLNFRKGDFFLELPEAFNAFRAAQDNEQSDNNTK